MLWFCSQLYSISFLLRAHVCEVRRQDFPGSSFLVSEEISEKSEKSEDEVENVLRVGGAKWETRVMDLIFPHCELWQEKNEGNSHKKGRKFLMQICWSHFLFHWETGSVWWLWSVYNNLHYSRVHTSVLTLWTLFGNSSSHSKSLFIHSI